jgi:hypothetical protein
MAEGKAVLAVQPTHVRRAAFIPMTDRKHNRNPPVPLGLASLNRSCGQKGFGNNPTR